MILHSSDCLFSILTLIIPSYLQNSFQSFFSSHCDPPIALTRNRHLSGPFLFVELHMSCIIPAVHAFFQVAFHKALWIRDMWYDRRNLNEDWIKMWAMPAIHKDSRFEGNRICKHASIRLPLSHRFDYSGTRYFVTTARRLCSKRSDVGFLQRVHGKSEALRELWRKNNQSSRNRLYEHESQQISHRVEIKDLRAWYFIVYVIYVLTLSSPCLHTHSSPLVTL